MEAAWAWVRRLEEVARQHGDDVVVAATAAFTNLLACLALGRPGPTASLKAWDQVAAENAKKSEMFRKVYESQRAYAAKVVPAKRALFPPYSFAANYYWPQDDKGAAKAATKQ